MLITPHQIPPPAVIEAVDEMMKIYRSLPPRPTIDEVEAAMAVLKTVDTEEQMRIEEISNQKKPPDVPEELFFVLQEVKKNMVLMQSHEQRKEAVFLVDVEKRFQAFDELIQRASKLVSGDTQMRKQEDLDDPIAKMERKGSLSDENLIGRKKDKWEESRVSKELLHGSFKKDAVLTGQFGFLLCFPV